MSIQNFIPELWDATLLTALYEQHVYAQPSVVNRDYEGQVTKYGDTVHITGVEPMSITDYKRYGEVRFEEIDLNTRTIRIDQARAWGMEIDDLDAWQAMGNVTGPALAETGYAMSAHIDHWVAREMATLVDSRMVRDIDLSLFDSETDPEVKQRKISAAIREVFVTLRTRLRRNNVPEGGRWAVVSPEVYAHMLLDPHFIRANERGSASIVEGNGVVGSMYGFTIMESNNVPTADDGSTHQILAGTNRSYSFAEGLAKTEPVRFEKKFVDGVKGLHVFGGNMVRPEFLCMVNLGGVGIPDEPVSFRDEGWTEADQKPSVFSRVTGQTGVTEKLGDPENVDNSGVKVIAKGDTANATTGAAGSTDGTLGN